MHLCQNLFLQNEVEKTSSVSSLTQDRQRTDSIGKGTPCGEMGRYASAVSSECVPLRDSTEGNAGGSQEKAGDPVFRSAAGFPASSGSGEEGAGASEVWPGNLQYRRMLHRHHRIVVKIGSSSLLHEETGRLDYHRIDRLARELSDLKNRGKEVILVSSGATAVGREVMGGSIDIFAPDTRSMSRRQAYASIGQARLIMIYQKFFEDYNQVTGQILMTKTTVVNSSSRENLYNTITELLNLGVIPIVNENDTVATTEYSLGDNDSLSAMVAAIIHADLLILLSDVDGLYTDDPRSNLNARFIEFVPHLTDEIMSMGKETTGSGVGTGGMNTKLHAAKMATASGCDMVIVNTKNGMDVISDIMDGRNVGTLFRSEADPAFHLVEYVEETY